MDESLPNRLDKGPGGGFGANSGEARRFRLREFHEKKNRSPGFCARTPEDFVRTPVFSEPLNDAKREWRAPPIQSGAGNGERPRRPAGTLLVMIVLAVVSGLTAAAGFVVGRERGKASANREISQRVKTLKHLPEKEAELLIRTIKELRAGRAESALETLQDLRIRYPQAASLSYLAAVAAMQAGQFGAAENFANDSIRTGQRVSDSLALMSVLERRKTGATGSGGSGRSEELLRAAITADPANPAPHLELASLLRGASRRDEARKEILAARACLNPVDAYQVMEVTLALMDLEDTAGNQLPAPAVSPRNLTTALTAAYISMRKESFEEAAILLQAGKEMTSLDVFYYLVNDPVFRRYRDRSELVKFWQ